MRRLRIVVNILNLTPQASPKHMIPDLNNGDTPRKHWRPSLPTRGDLAVQSSDNFQAANVHDLGLLDHHKKSTVTSIPEEERGRLAHDLRRLTSASSAGEIGEEEDAMEDR